MVESEDDNYDTILHLLDYTTTLRIADMAESPDQVKHTHTHIH